MMTKIPIKGVVSSNDDAVIYDWLGMDHANPKQVENALTDNNDQVEVDIASGGGSVAAASEIYSMLKAYSGKVVVNIQGLAASAASVIAMAGDEINMSPTAQMMIHKASMLTAGNADDLNHDSKVLDVTDQSIVNAYEAKTGLKRDDILQMMANETWMTAQDALDKGFIDNISTGSESAQVVNAVSTPVLSNNAMDKIRTMLAKAKQPEPKASQKEEKPTPSLRDQKLAILLGKDDE
nr:MAG TPA: Putative ATP dependent Clp protease [Caudoviricetes sp.]